MVCQQLVKLPDQQQLFVQDLPVTTTGASSELGVDYQWQSSTNQTTWTDIAGATDTTYSGTQTAATYYRMRVVCTNSNDTSYTNDWFISQGGAGSVPYLEDLESLSLLQH